MNKAIQFKRRHLPTPALEKISRIFLYSLVTLLVFEGIIRKLVPAAFGTAIFFLKDIICILSLFLVYDKYSYSLAFVVKQKWVWVCIAFIPLLIMTFILDPFLSLFAAKQYLLYTVVVLLIQYCFFNNPDIARFRNFLFYLSSLLIPTVIISILQNSLPASSWLNQSVGGESLEAFSAAGYLRVSSTFSFTGQYSWFLNIECPIVITYIILSTFTSKKITPKQIIFWLVLAISYLISIFITGGRTAVLGAAATVAIGFIVLLLKRPLWVLSNGVFIILAIVVLLSALQTYKPEYFAAYTQRSSGSDDETHEEEIQGRISNSLTDWTKWIWTEDISNILMGNGLGVMSNGSDQFSSYAKKIRSTGLWTENDTSTIFWEGGLYLAIVWYAFRFFIIIMSFRIYWSLKDRRLNSAGAFLFAYILINGLIGTLSLQPPIAIWWWLAVGVLLTLKFNEGSILEKYAKTFKVPKKRFELATIQ